MDRFQSFTDRQKQILHRMFDYLGFNEITTFDKFLSLVFQNVKYGLGFEIIVNHTLKHIVTNLKKDYPDYDKYIKHFWLKEQDMLEHMNVGSKLEYDPKGILRYYIKNKFNDLANSKI